MPCLLVDTAEMPIRNVQPIVFRVSFNLHLPSESRWSLFNGTWQKRLKKLDPRLRSETEEMTLHMQQAGLRCIFMNEYTYPKIHLCIK